MTGSPTRMLPLLLLFLFISSNQSSPTTRSTCKMNEINTDVGWIGKSLTSCPENCSSVQDTDVKCKCLNLTTVVQSPENTACKRLDNPTLTGCDFLEYFCNGLTSLHSSFSMYVNGLTRNLPGLVDDCKKINFCSMKVENKTVVSPKTFHKQLESVIQKINNKLS